MNVEEFLKDFLGVLYVSEGWETPLTMERLHGLLSVTLDELERRKVPPPAGGIEPHDPRLVAKYRIPLDENNAGRLHRTLLEFPDHEFAIEGPFLVIRGDF